ncbi:MAG TPA: HEAT repeat domain-containing protein, partial [Myxococcota bacterium]|nr:HEAT repeat domain-containing protein [Myxococcota bacterium]
MTSMKKLSSESMLAAAAPATGLLSLPSEVRQRVFADVEDLLTLSWTCGEVRRTVQDPAFLKAAYLQRGLRAPERQDVPSLIRAFPLAVRGQRLLASIGESALRAGAASEEAKGARTLLLRVLTHPGLEPWWDTSRTYLALLQECPSTDRTGVLLGALQSDKGFDREAAIAGLAGEEGVKDALIKSLEDNDPGVRAAALKALSGLAGEPGVKETLIRRVYLGDVPRVREAALEALSGLVGDADVKETFLRHLGAADIGRAAVEALSRAAGEQEVKDALVARLRAADR